MLEKATQGIPADFLGQPGVALPGAALNDIYLIVNTVDDLPSGAYVFHRDLKALELLKEGDYRRQAGHLGLDQPLPADASVDFFFMTNLNPILERFVTGVTGWLSWMPVSQRAKSTWQPMPKDWGPPA